MKKVITISLVVVISLVGLAFSGSFTPARADAPNIYVFTSMVGIPTDFTGVKAPIRGINGGGLPWMLTAAQGVLQSNGHLELSVQGLVLAGGALAGTNPIPNFRVIVSCLRSDTTVENVMTGLIPATTGSASSGGGDAMVNTVLSLPQPCIAPLVFVTSPGGAWFATTGH